MSEGAEPGTSERQRVLVIEHEDDCPAAWIGDWLIEAGALLDVRRPFLGDALPESLDDHDGVLVLGGSMGAYDDAQHPWLTATKALMRQAVADGTPTLGICLGHQLAAVATGGAVAGNSRGQQIGLFPVGWRVTADDDPLFAGVSRATRGVQWNDDVVTELPQDAVVLAATGQGEVQAVRFAPSLWGVQWHPELGADILARWADSDRDRALERGIDVDVYVAQVAAATEELQAWRSLAFALVDLARRSVPHP